VQIKSSPAAPPVTDDAIAREIVVLANRLLIRMWVHHHRRIAELDLSGPEAKALLNLKPDRWLSMTELAGRLHANPSNVTVAVGRLEARGLVSRQGGDDRRVRGVMLTAAGETLRARLEARLADDSPAVRGLSSAERLALRDLLERLDERPPR
jgi:DNA-binding MarR family transcriptional regulator